MSGKIHSTAVVDPSASLGADVEIGPYVTIGPQVTIGDRTRLLPNCHILRRTTLGSDCIVSPTAILGGAPQDVKYTNEETDLRIGDRTRIGEFATLHRGTVGGGVTIVGDDCMIMAYSHVAHDCRLGNHVIIANASHLSGHTHIEDRATLSGGCLVHQFVTLGTMAFLNPTSFLKQDVPPYMIAQALDGGSTVRFVLNQVGLERNNVPKESIAALRKACRLLFHRKNAATLSDAAAEVSELDIMADTYVANLVDHVRASLAGRKMRALERKRGS